jgi:hypothetical protein
VKSLRQNDQIIIWFETLVIVAAYAIAIRFGMGYFIQRVNHSWLALALGFCSVQCIVVVSLLVWLMVRKQWFLWLKVRSQRLYPVIQQQLALVALGTKTFSSDSPQLPPTSTPPIHDEIPRDREFMMGVRSIRDRIENSGVAAAELEDVRKLQQRYPLEFENCFVRFLPSMTGVGKLRLSLVAEELGLVEKWRRRYQSRQKEKRRQAVQRLSQLSSTTVTNILQTALNDSEALIRIEAARGLVHGGGQVERERLFPFLTTQPLIVRSMLMVDLMPYAYELSERAIPQALASADRRVILVTLQVIESWARVLPQEKFFRLLEHQDAEVRAHAFRALPFINGIRDSDADREQWIATALEDDVPAVRAAAATAAGRMSYSALLPSLEKALGDVDSQVASASAFALARIPGGPEVLEKSVVTSPPLVAAAALEALEKLHMGRLHFED